MKKLKLLILFAGLIVSCQKDIVENNPNEQIEGSQNQLQNENPDFLELVALTGNYKTSLEEAKELAISTATEMRAEEGISAKMNLSISSVETITEGKKEKFDDSVKKRGELASPDMYLFNFSDNQGYVLVSADNRIPGVLAYSSAGNLGNVVDNPGEVVLLERAHSLIEKKRKEFDSKKEQFKKSAENRLLKNRRKEECMKRSLSNRSYTSYGNWSTNYKRGPLVKTLWYQSDSYNDYVTKKCGKDEAPVGCVAVAVGQIMAYHEEPNWFKGRYMNWDNMKNRLYGNLFSSIYTATGQDAKNDIRFLLKRLGDKDLLEMDYDCKGSGSNIYKALRTFKKTGYKNVRASGHNINSIISEIKQYRPVYIRGCAFKEKYRTGWWPFRKTRYRYKECHAWVLDGYVRKIRTVTTTTYDECINRTFKSTYTQSQELIHNNFGWGGLLSGNYKGATGWYHKGLYDANNLSDEVSNHSFKSERENSGETNNFKFDNKILIGIEND